LRRSIRFLLFLGRVWRIVGRISRGRDCRPERREGTRCGIWNIG
jgi:hypothetical protein